MHDFLILAAILGAKPICFFRPYFGILMWIWIVYFNRIDSVGALPIISPQPCSLVVLIALALQSKQRILAAFSIVVCAWAVLTLAPGKWMDRMTIFVQDTSFLFGERWGLLSRNAWLPMGSPIAELIEA
jgi:hypothetical protein